jgi:type IV pilus assembly protein PilB
MTPSRSISPFSPVNRRPQEVVTLPAAAPAKGAPKAAETPTPEKANGPGPETRETETTAVGSPTGVNGHARPATILTMPAAPKESAKKAVHDPFWLGTRLLELKKLTAGQLETAIAMYRTHPREGFASALERLSFCSQGQIARLLAEKHGLEYVEIPRRGIAAAVVQKLRQVRATHHIVVPYKEEPGRITVAVADPTRYTAVDGKRDFPNLAVKLVVAAKGDILAAITDAYTTTPDDQTPKQILEEIIAWAATDEVSDIHIEPRPDAVVVRRRRNGRLHYHAGYGVDLKQGLVQAVKLLAKLDIGASALPLDGKGSYKAGATTFNLRISTMPTLHGEKAVIRLQNETKNLRSLTELGLEKEQIELLVQYAARPDGVMFITGPTGSGKTTLLYALMAVSVGPDEAVITIEDPVEYTVTDYAQSAVEAAQGRTFGLLLRAAVRQDPDVILVGEVRDRETAEIAIHSAQTGHRVFTTLHAVSAPAAVGRLTEMGVEPYLITGAVKAVVGTRLVRTLCSCSEPVIEPRLSFIVKEYGDGEYREPCGCELCKQTGFKGQTLIAEIYPLDKPGTAELILKKTPTEQFTAHMRQFGRSMYEHGMEKARAGISTIEEILAAVSS